MRAATESGRREGGQERWKPMNRNIDVMTEMRKLTDRKPVQAMAGAGVLASQTLKDLPRLLVRWRTEHPVAALPSRATGYAQKAQSRATGYAQKAQSRATGYAQKAQSRATGYAQKARALAADRYEQLAARGMKALNGQSRTAAIGQDTTAPSGTGKSTVTSPSGDTTSPSN
jgi:aminoglycoside phosphotransferase family enzyme